MEMDTVMKPKGKPNHNPIIVAVRNRILAPK